MPNKIGQSRIGPSTPVGGVSVKPGLTPAQQRIIQALKSDDVLGALQGPQIVRFRDELRERLRANRAKRFPNLPTSQKAKEQEQQPAPALPSPGGLGQEGRTDIADRRVPGNADFRSLLDPRRF